MEEGYLKGKKKGVPQNNEKTTGCRELEIRWPRADVDINF